MKPISMKANNITEVRKFCEDSNNNVFDNFVLRCLSLMLPSEEDTMIDEADLEAEDPFAWAVEGVLIMIAFFVGMFGNGFSVIVFSRQKVHRIFHHLLLLLSIFDMVSNFLLHLSNHFHNREPI